MKKFLLSSVLLVLVVASSASVEDFYNQWKNAYYHTGCCDGCGYVQYQGISQMTTVSEAIGYGMLFSAAVGDQNTFDSLYRYYTHFPSDISGTLMSWKQTDCHNVEGGGAASDADLDAAFGLVLAAERWSSGGFDYRGEAHKMLNAIKQWERAPQGYMWLGNWGNNDQYREVTRSTDFSPMHFRKFAEFTGDDSWWVALNWGYDNFAKFQNQYSPNTGLFSDFMEGAASNLRPAHPGTLEGSHDPDYAYNACRDPMRIGMDWIYSGEGRAKEIVKKMNNWVKSACGGQAQNIWPGYHLDGSPYDTGYHTMSFIAPFGVSAMVDDDQGWKDQIWNTIQNWGLADYYADSLKLYAWLAKENRFKGNSRQEFLKN